MQLKGILVLLLLLASLCGCVPVRAQDFQEQVFFVNTSSKPVDFITVMMENNGEKDARVMVVYPGTSRAVYIWDRLVFIGYTSQCYDLVKENSRKSNSMYFFDDSTVERLRRECTDAKIIDQQELMELVGKKLSPAYATCVLFDGEGNLEVMSEFETPWAHKARRYQCSMPSLKEQNYFK